MDPVLIDLPERLQTERLVLRAPRPGDGAVLCDAVAASLDELKPWMPWAQGGATPAESEAHARRMHARFVLREDLVYLAFERAAGGGEGLLVASTGLHRIDWQVGRFEIGYWRRAGQAGRGWVSEAVRALARMAFDVLKAQRVEIRLDDRNLASARVAERCGFRLEGLLRRDALAVDGTPRDTRVYARVRGLDEPTPL